MPECPCDVFGGVLTSTCLPLPSHNELLHLSLNTEPCQSVIKVHVTMHSIYVQACMQPGHAGPCLVPVLHETGSVIYGLLYVDTSLSPAPIKNLLVLNKLATQSCCNAIASEQVYQSKQPWYVVHTGSHCHLCQVSSSCLSVATQTDT